MLFRSHFSTIALTETGSEAFDLPTEIIGPDPSLAQNYLKASSLAFLTQHLTGDTAYEALLTAEGITQLGEDPIRLTLVQSLTGPSLSEQLGGPPRSAADAIVLPEEPAEVLPEAPQPAFSTPPLQQP